MTRTGMPAAEFQDQLHVLRRFEIPAPPTVATTQVPNCYCAHADPPPPPPPAWTTFDYVPWSILLSGVILAAAILWVCRRPRARCLCQGTPKRPPAVIVGKPEDRP